MTRFNQHRSSSTSFRGLSRSNTMQGPYKSRFGFTLVEMLIAVALILIIMTMFAEIFQIAAGSLSKQRSLTENDQRARMLTTIIRGDLEKRTFRDVIPFSSNQDTRVLGGLLLRRSGYWYYAENDPGNDTDDELQFTVRTTLRSQSTDATPYLGVATPFSALTILSQDTGSNQFTVAGDYSWAFPSAAPFGNVWISGSLDTNGTLSNDGRYGVTSVSVVGGNTQIYVDRTTYSMATLGTMYLTEFQPDLDDGMPGNRIGQSSAAEVAYFMRNGNLYRRVLLIRDADPSDGQPRLITGSPVFTNTYIPSGGSFWRDFDYSAFYFRGTDTGAGLTGSRPYFHTAAESLNNDANAPKELLYSNASLLPFPAHPEDQFRIISLGIPQLRFGHDPWTGIPFSFALPGNDNQMGTSDDSGFIGRYTLAECSDPAFGYPGTMSMPNTANPAQDQSPMSMNNSSLTLNLNGAVSSYSTVSPQRRGADIIMTNVLGFDVKVWDRAANNGIGQFVDVGDSSVTTGSFVPGNCQNFYYSPGNASGSKYRYDTWHPKAVTAQPGSPANRNSNPPFSASITAVQITINYRDISGDQTRQLTIVHSLVDPY